MMHPPVRDRHLDLRAVLDYLDQRADAAAHRAVDEHLARPCPDCRERVRAVGELLETMRLDRTGDVPAPLRAHALAAFRPPGRPGASQPFVEAVARLVFDSLAAPLAAPVRRSVGEARRLRFALAGHVLDLELEAEGPATVSLRGRLEAEDPALWTLAVRRGDERFAARPDATGALVLTNLPSGPLELELDGPEGRFRLPTFES